MFRTQGWVAITERKRWEREREREREREGTDVRSMHDAWTKVLADRHQFLMLPGST
jgi:hypothetical protein